MVFSEFGSKFLGDCGILHLMDDLGQAARQEGVIMLGGGNPGRIPQVEEVFRTRMERMLDSESDFERLIGAYEGPSGHQPFIDALVDMLREEYNWDIDTRNVVLTNGSQTAFFYLFNLVAGAFSDDTRKRILLPLAPEYIGYADVGITDRLFTARKPEIEFLDDRLFKYHIDFDGLVLSDDIGAICVSRPTNPTGNVLTEDEIKHLSRLAEAHGIPLIVDNAYGAPFPHIIYTEAVPHWQPHIILCMSLSKLGMPGARTGIVVAREEVVRAITGMNAVMSLAPNGLGPALAVDAVRTRSILALSEQLIKPHYWRKAQLTVDWMREGLDGADFFIHKPEGAFFLWMWFRGLPISCQELYERLKRRGVVVVPGHYFFPGLEEEWQHRYECIRVNYAGEDELVRAGIQIIADEVRRAYAEG
jgi:valine--pyruvate aminotransferase